MAYGLIIPRKIQAQDAHALNRSAVSDALMENGMCGSVAAKSTTAGEKEVFTFVTPATATLAALWMVWEPEVVLTDSKYKGLNPDPRDFIIPIGDVFSIFKPMVGDLISMSADAVGGTQSTNEYVVATDGQDQLQWAASAVSGLSLHLLDDSDYVSIGLGSIGTQRVTMDLFEVVAVA